MLSGFFARCGLAALLIVGCREVASAQATPSPAPSSPSPLAEIGHVTTSDRHSVPIGQTSRPTFVVDRARIENEGARTVADALRNVPGVELFAYGPFGAQVDYGIRGAISARTLILIDGQPVADPTTGTVNLDQLSTIGVQRIEVVESASSALYGTSASGGVVNIMTSVPRGTYLEGSLGSYADRDLRVGVGDGRVGASFERHVATDAYPYPPFNYGEPGCTTAYGAPCNFPGGVRQNTYGDQSTGRLSTDLRMGSGFRLRGHADVSALDIGIPSRLDALTPNTTYRLSNDTALLELEHTMKASTLSLDVSGTTQRASYADPSFGADGTYWGRTQLSLKDAVSGTRSDFVAGIDLTRASGVFSFPASTTPASGGTPATTTPAFAAGASQSQAAAYVQFGASPIVGTRFTAGLRAEHDAPAGSVLAPSFGGVIRLGPNVRVAGNVSESFAVPTLQDLYYPGAANPKLQPEKSQDRDVTVAYDTPHGAVSIGWFARSGSNFIVFDPVKFIPVNAQRAQTAGIMATARTAPFHGLVADAGFIDLYDALDLTTGARLPRNPVGQASVGLTRPFGPTRTSFGIRFGIVGSDGDDAANVSPPLVGHYDSYTSLDAFARYKFAAGGVISVRGFNLGNDGEASIFGYPNLGRRFSVELSTR